MRTRVEPPQAFHGILLDELTEDARSLWKAQGGTEEAWVAWSSPRGEIAEVAEGHWEKATKPLPDFELPDLSGKIWRLKDFQGKALLISVWAT
ncbi:MAG TPA: hypothetical protein VHZ55_05900 [Bryobacteraceae bacterium]|nr:hypothetical protein [Bryobacteraceae bacterium]